MLSKIKNWFLPNKKNNFQPRVLNDRSISVFILLFLLIKVVFSFNLILVKQSSLFADISAQRVLALTNEVRQQYNLPMVQEDSLLDKAAQDKARDMLTNKYFDHNSPDGITPWHWFDQAGYNFIYAGENLAMNFLDSEEVIRGWLNSPSHKENLLNRNYKDIGIAVLSGDFNNEGINRILVVQMFGSKAKLSIPVAMAQAPIIEEPVAQEELVVSENVLNNEEILSKTTKTTEDIETIETIETTETTIQTVVGVAGEQTQNIINQQVLAQKSILAQINGNTRNQVGMVNKIIAGFIILLGTLAIAGIILQQRTVAFGYSELVLRSAIIIVLGISFAAFHLESLVGHLMIV
jgi:hypothetical protein